MYHIAMTQWIVGDEPLEVSCKRLHDCGYDGIEFAAEPDLLDADQCNSLMQKYGLNCHSLCGIFNEERDLTGDGEIGEKAVKYLEASVDFAEKVGAKIIIVVPSPVGRTVQPEGKTLEELWANAVQNVQKAAAYADKHHVKFAVECINRYETYLVNTISRGLEFVKDVNRRNVGLMADLFHMSLEERSIVDALYSMKDYLLHVHIADNTREPAGMGTTDFKEILLALKRIGYTGSLTMEFMYRLSNPYAARGMNTQTQLMDQYTKQAIDYIRMIERSIDY